MPLIGLIGPNAIGKTSTMRRWAERYPMLTAVSADGGTFEIHQGEFKRRGDWKCGEEGKLKLVQEYAQRDSVVAIESARTTQIKFLTQQWFVICVTCPPERLAENIRLRCEKKGKRFRDDRWSGPRLEGDSTGRYVRFCEKHLNDGQWKHFVVDDRERDWPAVDEYFGKLFRKLHNQLLRERRCR